MTNKGTKNSQNMAMYDRERANWLVTTESVTEENKAKVSNQVATHLRI
jgi:hypothetical protein